MSPTNELVHRRRRLRNAVFPAPSQRSTDLWPSRAVDGTIVDASPHLLVLAAPDGSQARIPMSATATIWHAGRAEPSALRAGRHAVVRSAGTGGLAAERIWVDITRVTGVIADRSGDVFQVNAGPHRGLVTVVVPDHAMRHIQVRHPRLEPGALFDVIGVRRHGRVEALRPAVSSPQPAPHAALGPLDQPSTTMQRAFRGTATWYDRPDGVLGAAYPALDPHGDAGGCGTGPAVALPYLSLGSELIVHNECTERYARVPVIECGCVAARFRDRCVTCGTSPRGRLVELSTNAFVALGGDLDAGCFNVTVRVSS